jgi:hypothetical protein
MVRPIGGGRYSLVDGNHRVLAAAATAAEHEIERIARLLAAMTAEERGRVKEFVLWRIKEAERQQSEVKKREGKPGKAPLVRRTRRAEK